MHSKTTMNISSRNPAIAETEYVTISMTVILIGLDSSVFILVFCVLIVPDTMPPNLAVYTVVIIER